MRTTVGQPMSLYRKYRPQKFSDLVGQKDLAETLSTQIKSGKSSHAYLFTGPKGTGKTTTARIIAKALNCLSPAEGEPDGKCTNCLSFEKGSNFDIIEIDAASNRGIEEIRDLREKIKLSPTQSSYKVYIIDEVHMLTTEAFNALLKTLEEPPQHAIFILCTTEPHKVPGTVASRAQKFEFKRADGDS
ncbi:MAG TPA: DNA polymerase III subunit gamma/tau, partial [Patescibacteria group bacterium]|nr:DNA polymerase III subunit gamma/tau [Patescibacteria group bacterium]